MNETVQNPQNIYELLEDKEGEIMVLIYASKVAPKNAEFYLNTKTNSLEIKRNSKDVIILDGLQPETMDKLKSKTMIYVCEMKYSENQEERQIAYSYTAKVLDEKKNKENEQQAKHQKQDIAQKAKQAREKILEKQQKKS